MKFTLLLAGATLAAGASAFAQGAPAPADDHSAHHAPAVSRDAAPLTEGEVRKIDKEQAKLTLRHGPLVNLDMPAMTMVFKAADPKMLDGLKVGDKVRFSADKLGGVFTVTAIEAAN